MVAGVLLLIAALFFLAIVSWNVAAWPRVEASTRSEPRAVSVLIPARNEAANIEACVESALAQGETALEVLVYDDHSVDETRSIVRRLSSLDGRVRLIAPKDLPAGWCGKNFACAELASEARGEWLLFLDADARLAPGAAAGMVREACRRDLSMLSCWPGLILASFWEKALMPMLNFVVLSLYPAPLAIVRDDPSLGLAHGACILAKRSTYRSVGGHAAVRGEVFEDTRLAHLWRAKGERQLCLDGRRVISVRMYSSLAEIWNGFRKNFFPAFRRESSFWAFLFLRAAVFLGPFILVAWDRSAVSAAAAACVIAMRLLLAVRFGHPWLSALAHPLGETVLILIGLSSWRALKSGKGVEWKGRRLSTSLSKGAANRRV